LLSVVEAPHDRYFEPALMPASPIDARDFIFEGDNASPIFQQNGTTIPTGKLSALQYESTACRQPQLEPAGQARLKDNAAHNIQYLGVEQGLSSSYINVVTTDKRGALRIGA